MSIRPQNITPRSHSPALGCLTRVVRQNRSLSRASVALAVTALGLVMATSYPAAAQEINDKVDLISSVSDPIISAATSSKISAESVPMSFAEVENILWQHPLLDSFSLGATAERSRAEGALGLPDPVVSLQINNVPLFDPSFSEYLPSNKAVGIRQALPSRDERKANSLKSLRSAAVMEGEREQQYAKMRGQVLTLLIAKTAIEERRNLVMMRSAKYDELAEIIDIEINAGRPLLFRLAQVDVERSEVSTNLSELATEEAEINAELVNLLGVIPHTPLPELNKIPLTGNALQFHGVRLADLAVNVSDAEIQKAEADFKPDWGVNLTYQQRESGQGPRSNFDGEDWISGGVTFSIPLWAGQRQEPNLRAAKTDKNAAMARRTSIARKLQSDWLRYDARQKSSQENIKIFEAKIKAIEEKQAAQLISYESGAGDYSSILDAEIAVLMLRSEIVKAQTERDQLIATMNSLLVTPS